MIDDGWTPWIPGRHDNGGLRAIATFAAPAQSKKYYRQLECDPSAPSTQSKEARKFHETILLALRFVPGSCMHKPSLLQRGLLRRRSIRLSEVETLYLDLHATPTFVARAANRSQAGERAKASATKSPPA